MATKPTTLNLAQYNFALGDTVDVITKQNGVNTALDAFSGQLNTMVDEIAAEQQQVINVASGHATNAGNSATAAAEGANLAALWANEAEDVEVTTGEYSAFHWKQKAQAIALGTFAVTDLQPGTGTPGQYVTPDGSGGLIYASLADVATSGSFADLSGSAAPSRYDLNTATTTATLDLAAQQVFRVDASVNRTLAFTNSPAAGRGQPVVIRFTGNGAITWPAGISWDGGAAPELNVTWTAVTLLNEGAGWYGFKSGGAD